MPWRRANAARAIGISGTGGRSWLRIAALAIVFAAAPWCASVLADQRAKQSEPFHTTPVQAEQADVSNLVRDALQAGGASAAQSRQAKLEFRGFARLLRESGHVRGSGRQQAEAIHHFLHERVLRGKYETSGNDLAAALAGGPYNCLTASILFLALAAEFDVDAQAVTAPGHVWCRVSDSRGHFDVETTCAHWFELTAREPAHMPIELERFMAEHRRRAITARGVHQHALIGLIHYNRGVRFLREGQFSAAAVENFWALTLDPGCEPAFDNLLATINNWSLALADQGEREPGLDLLVAGLALAGDYEPFHSNYRWLSQRQPAASEPRTSGDRAANEPQSRVFKPRSVAAKTGLVHFESKILPKIMNSKPAEQ